MRASTEQALDLAGFAVRSFGSAAEALTLCGRGLNGVVVSDLRMPGMDGMALLHHLTELDRDLPVILITGHADVQLAVDAMRRGTYDFIEKLFSIAVLSAVLRRVLDHRAVVMDNQRLRAVAGQQDDLEAWLPGPRRMVTAYCCTISAWPHRPHCTASCPMIRALRFPMSV